MKLPFVSRERFEALDRALAEEKIENRRLLDLLLAPLVKKEIPETPAASAPLGEVVKSSNKEEESPSPSGGTPLDRATTDMHRHFKGATPPAKWRARG